MRKAPRPLLGCAAAALVVLAACSDASRTVAPPTAVSANGQTANGLLGDVLGTLTRTVTGLLGAAPLTRSTALENDVSWTFTATRYGAISSNSAVGLTITVPPGAVDAPTTFTVTALKGSAVAYAFEPHAEFDQKVVLTQNLRNTNVGLLTRLYGAHFEGDRLEFSGGLVRVTEVVPALLSFLTKTASFGVDHFSGWIVASGYE